MEEGLHLELIIIPMDGSSFSQGQLTLNEAGNFTVQIKEYKELRERSANLKMMRGKTLLNPSIEKNSQILVFYLQSLIPLIGY